MADTKELDDLKHEVLALQTQIKRLEGRINDMSLNIPKHLERLEALIKEAKAK